VEARIVPPLRHADLRRMWKTPLELSARSRHRHREPWGEHDERSVHGMSPATCLTVRAERELVPVPQRPVPGAESGAALERVARALRGARARTGMSEGDVVALLERLDRPITADALCAAESSGAISLCLAACLADVYGTTTDALAGRGLHRQRLPLGECPGER